MPTNEVADLGLGDTALFERCRNPRDPVDRDAVVERFLPLARQIAARYQRPGGAVRRRLPGRLLRPRQGGRSLRPGPPDRVLDIRRAHDHWRDQALLPRPRVVRARPAGAAGARAACRARRRRAHARERPPAVGRGGGAQPSASRPKTCSRPCRPRAPIARCRSTRPRPGDEDRGHAGRHGRPRREGYAEPSNARCCRPSCVRSPCASATSSVCASTAT